MTLIIGNFQFHGYTNFSNDLTKEFVEFYKTYIKNDRVDLSKKLIQESIKVFNKWSSTDLIALSDSYFNNFSFVTQNLVDTEQYYRAFYLWAAILRFIKKWERESGKELHKGTAYYFCGVCAALQNDFDTTIMVMSLAVSEDKKNNPNWDQAPAYSFVSLNDKKIDQYFKYFVDRMIGFFRDRLDGLGNEKGRYTKHYHSTRSGSLTYEDFRSKFLDNEKVNSELRYYFAYTLIRLWHLKRLQKNRLGDEVLAPSIYSNALLDLLLVLDGLLKKLNNPNGKRWKMRDHYNEVARIEGWHSEDKLKVNERRDQDFKKWLISLINTKYKAEDGSTLCPLEADFVLAYGLRNFSAHSVVSQKILWDKAKFVLQALFNCIFKTLELL